MLFILCAALAATPPPPPLPPGAKLSKKTLVLSTAPAEPNVFCERVPVAVAETDGTNVTLLSQTTALKFTAPNPTQGSYSIAVSSNLITWLKISEGTGTDPLVVYDFSYQAQSKLFYAFQVDKAP